MTYDTYAKENGFPSAALMIKQLPGSNAQEVIDRIKEKMEELKEKVFLPGMDYTIGYDVSRFLMSSMKQVLITFIIAFILVFFVVYIFLGDFRSTLIPAIAIPVSLIGTFFFMTFFGFSINMITLFALVLAIGIVVDNAIVVVEAVHVEMEKGEVNRMAATKAAMRKISSAVIAITLVMSAIYIPVSFMSGPVGIFMTQFSITIAIAMVLSGLVALTLTPALCAILLKKSDPQTINRNRLHILIIGGFNKWFGKLSLKYLTIVKK